MKLSDLKLAIVYVNLAHREDRRNELEYQLAVLGWTAVRQPGIRADWVRDPCGFQNERRYACSLAKRLAIRRGMRTGADAVLLLEDDVVLHPEIQTRLDALDLPEAWGLLYLGCRHFARPEVHGPGLLKCTRATDNHAIVVRRSHYRQVMRGLAGTRRGAPRTLLYSDWELAQRQGEIPSYAAFPNLAWQAYSWSDTGNRPLTAYHLDGRQAHLEDMMREVTTEMEGVIRSEGHVGDGPDQKARCNMGICNDRENSAVASGRAELEKEPDLPIGNAAEEGVVPVVRGPSRFLFREEFPLIACVNLARRPDRHKEAWKQFARHSLKVVRRPAVDARFAKKLRGFGSGGSYGCALSHRLILRDGLRRGVESVVCLEDDVVLHQDFVELVEALGIPSDWGVFYFGCNHRELPEPVGPGVVRVTQCFATHAFAVRRAWLPRVIAAFAGDARARPGTIPGCDVTLSALSAEIPTYAAFPNLAWQREGFSDLMGKQRVSFDQEGRQPRGGRVWLPELERRMADLNRNHPA